MILPTSLIGSAVTRKPRREQERNVEPATRSSTTVKEREKRGALRA